MNFRLPWLALLLCGCIVEGDVGLLAEGMDDDGDGFAENEGDCNDSSDLVSPGRAEACDGLDNDCDGVIDEKETCDRDEDFASIAKLDFLVVVDNTASMLEEQTRLRQGIENLLEPMMEDGCDIHVGVITMDTSDPQHDGALVEVNGDRWVDSAWERERAYSWIDAALDVGTSSSAAEQARAAVFASLYDLGQTTNEGFRRDDADLAILLVSDEDDASGRPTIDEFMQWIGADIGTERFQAHAIVSTQATSTCGSSQLGTEHRELVDRTDGVEVEICNTNYSEDLSLIAQVSVSEAVPFRFELRDPAVPESVVVEVYDPWGNVDTLDSSRFYYRSDQQAVVIIGALMPPPNSVVHISYRAEPQL